MRARTILQGLPIQSVSKRALGDGWYCITLTAGGKTRYEIGRQNSAGSVLKKTCQVFKDAEPAYSYWKKQVSLRARLTEIPARVRHRVRKKTTIETPALTGGVSATYIIKAYEANGVEIEGNLDGQGVLGGRLKASKRYLACHRGRWDAGQVVSKRVAYWDVYTFANEAHVCRLINPYYDKAIPDDVFQNVRLENHNGLPLLIK